MICARKLLYTFCLYMFRVIRNNVRDWIIFFFLNYKNERNIQKIANQARFCCCCDIWSMKNVLFTNRGSTQLKLFSRFGHLKIFFVFFFLFSIFSNRDINVCCLSKTTWTINYCEHDHKSMCKYLDWMYRADFFFLESEN